MRTLKCKLFRGIQLLHMLACLSVATSIHGMDTDPQQEQKLRGAAEVFDLDNLDVPFNFNNEETSLRVLLNHCMSNPNHPFTNTQVIPLPQTSPGKYTSIKNLNGDYSVLMTAARFLFIVYKNTEAKFPYLLWAFKTKDIGKTVFQLIESGKEYKKPANYKDYLDPNDWPV